MYGSELCCYMSEGNLLLFCNIYYTNLCLQNGSSRYFFSKVSVSNFLGADFLGPKVVTVVKVSLY